MIPSRYLTMIAKHSKGCKLKLYRNYDNVNLNSKSKNSLILYFVFSLVISKSITSANSLEEVDDKELTKLINQEQYVAVLFSKFSQLFSSICIMHFQCRIDRYWFSPLCLLTYRWWRKCWIDWWVWICSRRSPRRFGWFLECMGRESD